MYLYNMFSAYQIFGEKLQSSRFLFIFLTITVVTAVLLSHFFKSNSKSQYPVVGADVKFVFLKNARLRHHWFKKGPEIIHSAFKKFPDTIFTLPSLDRTSIVLPPRFLNEIRELPSTIGSNSHATSDVSELHEL